MRVRPSEADAAPPDGRGTGDAVRSTGGGGVAGPAPPAVAPRWESSSLCSSLGGAPAPWLPPPPPTAAGAVVGAPAFRAALAASMPAREPESWAHRNAPYKSCSR